MRQLIAIVLVCYVSLVSTISFAEEEQGYTWKQLNKTSDQILQLVKLEKYEEAKQLLAYFSTLFLEMDFKEKNISMSSLQVVTMTYEKANEAVTAAGLSVEERIHNVTSFRLAIDALTSEHHPLWLQMEEKVMYSLQSLEEAIAEEDDRMYQHRLNEFLRHYNQLRPALLIHIKQDDFQRIDSQIVYLEKRRQQNVEKETMQAHLKMMETEWSTLFNQVKEDSADPSLWWVMIAIGGMITLSLSYVGWRKYKAEKQKIRMKE